MTNLKNTWNPGDGFFASDANAIATQINQNTADVAAAAAALSGKQPADADLTAFAALTPADGDTILRVAGAWVNRTMAQLKTALGLAKADVGLSNVDNTADTAKPVSTAQQNALDLKAPLASPAFTGTPTGLTKTHVGLGNVDNTSDVNKPVSTAQAAADTAAVAAAVSSANGHSDAADITTLATSTGRSIAFAIALG